MSWTIARLADGASGSRAEGVTNFSVVYYLRGDPDASPADTPLDAAGALAHALTPQEGDTYGTTFPGAFCVGVDPVCLGNGYEWQITCRYSAQPEVSPTIPADATVDDAGGGFPDDYDPTDPANGLEVIVDVDGATQIVSAAGDDPRRLPWQFEQVSRAALKERYNLYRVTDAGAVTSTYESPSILTNGRPLGDTIKEDVFLPVLQLSKSVPNSYITPLLAAYYEGSVNQKAITIAGIALLARQAMIMDFRIRRAYFGTRATKYWEVSLNIAIFDGTERSDIWVLQQDYYELAAGVLKVIEVGGAPSTRPALLDTNGAKTATPFYKKFARVNVRDWSPLKLPKRV